MGHRFLRYIQDDQQAEELKGKVVDTVWFEDNGIMVILFTDGTDIAIGWEKSISAGTTLLVEYREWQE